MCSHVYLVIYISGLEISKEAKTETCLFVKKMVDTIGMTVSDSHKADSHGGKILQPQRRNKGRALTRPAAGDFDCFVKCFTLTKTNELRLLIFAVNNTTR